MFYVYVLKPKMKRKKKKENMLIIEKFGGTSN